MAAARVLVIEDNSRIGDKLVEVLARAGFRASLARDASAGLAAFAAERPDLVLVEHLVPGVEGGRLVDRLRHEDEEVPIIVMATSPRAQARLLQQAPGFIQGFLLKPFRVPDLLTAVEAALGDRPAGPPPPEGARLVMEGELGPTSLAELLVALLRSAATGVLRMQRDGVRRDLYVLNGLPVFAESNLLGETFGRFLLARGEIDAAQYRAVRRHMSAHGMRQGECLVALGLLTHREVYGLLRGQVRERVVRCFDWEGAEYAFYEDARFVDDKLTFPMNPLALIVEGIVRRRTPLALQAWFDRVRGQAVVPTPLGQELAPFIDRMHREPALSTVLESGPTVEAVAEALRLVESRAAAIIEALRTIGAVRLGAEPLGPSATSPEGPAASTEFVLEAHDQIDPERTPDAEPVAERVLARYLATRGGDHFAVLGVPRDADEAAIETAYLDIAREFQPDRFADHPDAEVRLRAKEVLVKAGLAFGVLADPHARAAYRARLGTQAQAAPPGFRAEDELAQGEALLQGGDAAGAAAAFARAYRAQPEEPLYQMHLGFALFLAATDEAGRRQGEELVRRGVLRDPALALGHELLGRIYGATGRESAAAECAARAAHLGRGAATGGAR